MNRFKKRDKVVVVNEKLPNHFQKIYKVKRVVLNDIGNYVYVVAIDRKGTLTMFSEEDLELLV